MLSLSSGITPVLRLLCAVIVFGIAAFIFSQYQLLYTYVPDSISDYLASGSATPQIDWYTTRLLDERLPVRPKPQVRRWNICVCAMVHNEVPFLAEWIEHHRLQGVNHFVLYDYRSLDLVVYFPMFYEDNKVTDLIDHIPAKFIPKGKRGKDGDPKDMASNKHNAMIDCYMRHRNLTEWIIMMDVSQFLTSPKHGNIWKYIDYMKEEGSEWDKSVVETQSITYGPAENITTVFDTWMTPNSHTGGADLLYEPVSGTYEIYPLVLATNPLRQPSAKLDANFSQFGSCDGEDPEGCSHRNPPVVFVSAKRCDMTNVQTCIFNAPNKEPAAVPEGTPKPSLEDVTVKNFPWRPKNLSPGYSNWLMVERNLSAVPGWFSSVRDEEQLRHAEKIRKRIMDLKPRVFRNVGRKCVPEALKSGQQVKCPPLFPFPYGNAGINYLRDCCATDLDMDGNPLTENSTSCERNKKVQCRDPQQETWIHRSCCINDARI